MTNFAAPSVPLPPSEELERTIETFYNHVYAHPWLGRYFADVDRGRQVTKLARFIEMAWGDTVFAAMHAKYLAEEHAHMYIPAELFDIRESLLHQAFTSHRHPPALVEAIIAFNRQWSSSIIKSSVGECSDQFSPIADHPRPA